MPDVCGRNVGDFAFELLVHFFIGAQCWRGFEVDGVVFGGSQGERAVAAGGDDPSPFAEGSVDSLAEVCVVVVPVDPDEFRFDEQPAAGGGQGVEDAADPEAAIDDGVVNKDFAVWVIVGGDVLDDAGGVADTHGQMTIGNDQFGDRGAADGVVVLGAEVFVASSHFFETLAVDGLGDVGPDHEVREGGGADAEPGGGGERKNSGDAWSGHTDPVLCIGMEGSDA